VSDALRAEHLAGELCRTEQALHDALRELRELRAKVARLERERAFLIGVA
jgi:hypothetical protein